MGFAYDDEPVVVLSATQVRTGEFKLRPGTTFVASNAPFEDAIWEYVMHKKYGYPPMRDVKRWDCVMARALMVGLPGKLEHYAKVLGLPHQKDLEGRAAMLRLSKPKGYDALGDPIWENDPELIRKMMAYCAIDVEVERGADKVLPMMGAHERAIWEQDLIMNRRGVAVDIELARKASAIAGVITESLNKELRRLTGGFIDRATQIARIKAWLYAQGLSEFKPVDKTIPEDEQEEQEGLDKEAMIDLLARPDLSPLVRKVISIRQQVGKSSTSKYIKTIEAACKDGRVHGVLQYHAAHTGREGGRLIQPQNYPQGWKDDETKGLIGEVEQRKAIELIMTGDAELFSIMYGDTAMQALSDTLRGTIIAGPNKQLVSADYNSIELCVEMWLADDKATLAQLRAGEKPYVDLARAVYKDPTITKKNGGVKYEVGKRGVLGCGYQMGAKTFKIQSKTQYNLDISMELAETTVSTYREKYPLVVAMWKSTEAAAIAAVKNPGQAYDSCSGKVLWVMSRDRRFLVAKLPSGRFLWYWKPVVRMEWMTFCKDETCAHWIAKDVMKCPQKLQREQMCYWGKHPKTKQWVLLKTYGGLLVENVTQAVARDLMMHGLINCEKAGFEMLLTVHDELLGELGLDHPDDAQRELKEFISIMNDAPAWAAGCPVAAEGWIGPRYRK